MSRRNTRMAAALAALVIAAACAPAQAAPEATGAPAHQPGQPPQAPADAVAAPARAAAPKPKADAAANADTALLRWAATALTRAFSYAATDYYNNLQAASLYFTPEGWAGFEQALVDSQTLKTVVDKAVSAAATPVGHGAVLARRTGDRDEWDVVVPLKVVYLSDGSQAASNLMVSATVVTRPGSKVLLGLDRVVAAPAQ